jgi:transcriptional regulator with XRE-family HTH domain
MPRKPSLSRCIRDARIKRGWSVADLADTVGVSASSIYFWEADQVRPRDSNLSALCKALKLPIRATKALV